MAVQNEAARRALSLTFFVAQRKAEDPVVEVPTRRYDHRAGGHHGSLAWRSAWRRGDHFASDLARCISL